MKFAQLQEVTRFLSDHPGMSLCPSRSSDIILRGTFAFSAQPPGGSLIVDTYNIEMTIPGAFPRDIPSVKEIGGRIPRVADYHMFQNGDFCMGSPLRLMKIIAERPTLSGFVETCLVPFLYAVSHKLQHGGDFIFGGLPHGNEGIILDYMELFGLRTREQVLLGLRLLGMKRRIAIKRRCPCSCGRKLEKCPVCRNMDRFRGLMPRAWFREQSDGFNKKNLIGV